MGVVNEVLGTIKFITFFAWEERGIQQGMEARKREVGWMVKGTV